MVRGINSRNLTDYLANRVNEHSRKEKGQSHALLTAEVIGIEQDFFIKLINHKNRVFHARISYVPGKDNPDKVEIGIEPHFAGVSERDFAGFLREYIDNDKIFQSGQPLYRHAPRTDVLQRKESQDKMECLVVDEKAGDSRLKKAVYEYMMRPCLFYMLKKAGEFSVKP